MTDLQIRCFLALAEELNFTHASAKLAISQSTLSTHIRSLEKNIGMPLFERNNRLVKLTEAGSELYPVLQESYDHVQQTVYRLRAGTRTDREKLRIGYIAGMWFGSSWNPNQIVDEFGKCNPEIEPRVTLHTEIELNQLLQEGELDVIFSYGRVLHDYPGFEGFMLLENELCLLYEKERYKRRPFSMEGLSQETFVLLSERVSEVESSLMDVLMKQYHFTPRNIIYVESDEEKFLYIDMGQAIGIGSALSSGIIQRDYQVRTIPGIRFRNGFIRNKAYENRNAELFFDYLKASCKPAVKKKR